MDLKKVMYCDSESEISENISIRASKTKPLIFSEIIF
jgi:hypothetical protein